jgi:hypothetical protein
MRSCASSSPAKPRSSLTLDHSIGATLAFLRERLSHLRSSMSTVPGGSTLRIFSVWCRCPHMRVHSRRPPIGHPGEWLAFWQSLWQSGPCHGAGQDATTWTAEPTPPAATLHASTSRTGRVLLLIRRLQVRVLPRTPTPPGPRYLARLWPPWGKERFARLIHRPGRVLGGPAVRAACGGNLRTSRRRPFSRPGRAAPAARGGRGRQTPTSRPSARPC